MRRSREDLAEDQRDPAKVDTGPAEDRLHNSQVRPTEYHTSGKAYTLISEKGLTVGPAVRNAVLERRKRTQSGRRNVK